MAKELFTISMREINKAEYGVVYLSNTQSIAEISHIQMVKGNPRIAKARLTVPYNGKALHQYFDINDVVSFKTINEVNEVQDEPEENPY